MLATGDGASPAPSGGAQDGRPSAGAPDVTPSAGSGVGPSERPDGAAEDVRSVVANALPLADIAAREPPAAPTASPLGFAVVNPLTNPDGPTTDDATTWPGVPDVGLVPQQVVGSSVGGALDRVPHPGRRTCRRRRPTGRGDAGDALDAFLIPADAPAVDAGPPGAVTQGDAPAIGRRGTGIRRVANAPVVRRAGTVVSRVVAAPVVGRAGTLLPNIVAVPVVARVGDILGGGLASAAGCGRSRLDAEPHRGSGGSRAQRCVGADPERGWRRRTRRSQRAGDDRCGGRGARSHHGRVRSDPRARHPGCRYRRRRDLAGGPARLRGRAGRGGTRRVRQRSRPFPRVWRPSPREWSRSCRRSCRPSVPSSAHWCRGSCSAGRIDPVLVAPVLG